MDRSQCRKMIKLYEEKRLLWDTGHIHHINITLRKRAWMEIAQSLNFPVGEVKRKMSSLLGSYRCEKSREKKRHVLGKGQNAVYISKWFAYSLFGFLSTRNNPDIIENAIETMELPKELSQNITDTTTDNSKEQKMKCVDIESMRPSPDEHRPILVQSLNVPRDYATCSSDPHCTFGQHIANELRKYDPRTLAHVKHAINGIIFEADMGKYQDHTGGHIHPLGYEYVIANLQLDTRSPSAPLAAAPAGAASQANPPDDMKSSTDYF